MFNSCKIIVLFKYINKVTIFDYCNDLLKDITNQIKIPSNINHDIVLQMNLPNNVEIQI